MWVHHDRGRPVDGCDLGELRYAQHRRFNVDVPIDEAGADILPRYVDRLDALVRADPRDIATGHRDVTLVDLAGEHIDDLAPAQYQVRRNPTGRHIHAFGEFDCSPLSLFFNHIHSKLSWKAKLTTPIPGLNPTTSAQIRG